MNNFLQFLNLLGALGLFIYGMVVMSGSIQRLTGRRMRRAVRQGDPEAGAGLSRRA